MTQLERKVSKFDNSTLEACALALLLVLLNVAAASYATDANQMPVCLSECCAVRRAAIDRLTNAVRGTMNSNSLSRALGSVPSRGLCCKAREYRVEEKKWS